MCITIQMLEAERAQLERTWARVRSDIPLNRRTHPRRYSELLCSRLGHIDSSDRLNCTTGHAIRQIHDFYGWMAKQSNNIKGACAGTFYRTAGFISTPPSSRSGRKLGGNIHVEHTVPVAALNRALPAKFSNSSNFHWLAAHRFILAHSICTAFTKDEEALLSGSVERSTSAHVFSISGDLVGHHPFRRYLPIAEKIEIYNIVSGEKIDLAMFQFKDHMRTLIRACQIT